MITKDQIQVCILQKAEVGYVPWGSFVDLHWSIFLAYTSNISLTWKFWNREWHFPVSPPGYFKLGAFLEGRGAHIITFSDSESTSVPKVLNPDPGKKIFQIWESDSCSDSGCHRCNRNSTMLLLEKCHIRKPHRLLLLLKMKSDSGSGFSQIFDSGAGSERKTQDPSAINSGSVTTSGADRSGTMKNWVIGFVFSITARSASALAVAFFGLLEPLSYVCFDIFKLMRVSFM